MTKASNLIQLFLKKFHSLKRIQDQLIRIVYAYHYDRRHFFCISIRTIKSAEKQSNELYFELNKQNRQDCGLKQDQQKLLGIHYMIKNLRE